MRARLLVPLCAALALVLALAACYPPPPAGRGPNPLLASTKIVGGLQNPWDIAFTPDGAWMLFTQRNGILAARSTVTGGIVALGVAPFQFPVRSAGEGGLMGLAIDPQWPTRPYVYLCMATTALQVQLNRYELSAAMSPLTNGVTLASMPQNSSGRHSGCRPRFQPGTNNLFVGTGDAAMGTNPQSPASLGGKVLCVTGDGAPCAGAPFNPGFDPRIYSFGHRNVQGIAFDPANGRGYSVEHGPDRDDEVNLIETGDYGWNPVPGYNESVPMTRAGAKPAIWTSGPSTIAPSGMTILRGAQWKAWNGALAMAVLKGQELRVLFLDGSGTVVVGKTFAVRSGLRLRTAVQGPDGNLYISTDAAAGGDSIWRLVPR
jgi:aldose sugar dehydrogenase